MIDSPEFHAGQDSAQPEYDNLRHLSQLLALENSQFGYASWTGAIILGKVVEPASEQLPAIVKLIDFSADARISRFAAHGALIGSWRNRNAGVVERNTLSTYNYLVVERLHNRQRAEFAAPKGPVYDFRRL